MCGRLTALNATPSSRAFGRLSGGHGREGRGRGDAVVIVSGGRYVECVLMNSGGGGSVGRYVILVMRW